MYRSISRRRGRRVLQLCREEPDVGNDVKFLGGHEAELLANRLGRISTATVAGTTVVTEIAISIADRDCPAITATWCVRLELGELLISIRR